jgi:hypothetical protein
LRHIARFPAADHYRAVASAGAQVFNLGGAWGNKPVDGRWWVHGDIVNGVEDVWIRSDFLRCQ